MPALPEPRPGLVIHFNYLWRREEALGRDTGRKPRPCAIVIALQHGQAHTLVAVCPITHQPPQPGTDAVEIPAAVKRHLGLDEARSWIITDEFNEFEWPGFDLQPNADGAFAYGFIPPKLYEQVRQRLLGKLQAGDLGRIVR